jgi:hypothetical protein
MLKSWAIYRYEGSGKLRYLGVISATGQDDAMAKAIKLATRGRLGSPVREALGG